MQCTTCKAIVSLNATGICYGCQGGFNPQNKEDRYMPIETKLASKEEKTVELEKRQKELEDALQKQGPKSMDACKQAKDGQGMGERNAKRQKTSKKSKKR